MTSLNRVTSWRWPILSREKIDTMILVGACLLTISNHFASATLWVSLSSVCLMFARAWLTLSGKSLPKNYILIPVTVLLMAGIFYTYRSFFGREAGVAMLILLLACKMLEMRAKRDLFTVVFLGYFLILTSFFDSQSLISALQVTVSAFALLVAQLSFQFHLQTIKLSKRIFLVAKLVGLAIPLTVTCFFLFPRLQGPLWGLPSDANIARSGLSGSMSPGNISKLAMSEELVFRVRFIDDAPPKSKMYWRANVLNEFDGRTWTAINGQSTNRKRNENALLVKGSAIQHEVTLEPNGLFNLFVLDSPASAPVLESGPTSYSRLGEIRANMPIQQRTRYIAYSYVDYILDPNLDEIDYQQNTSILRRFNPRTQSFAASIKEQFPAPTDQIKAILNYFRTEKFYYTLEPPSLGRDTADEFLFTTRSGFCEHYASSFVILMRYLQIPARVVIGYQGGTLNTQDNFYEIRQSDAHAWAEVWLQGQGWVRVDPTAAVAPDRILKNLNATQQPTGIAGLVGNMMSDNGILNEIRMRWSALNNSWNQWVLNYNETKQSNLLERLGLSGVDWAQVIIRIFVIGLVLLCITALPLLRKRETVPALDQLYSRLCRKMRQYGFPKYDFEGPLAYLERIQLNLRSEHQQPFAQFIKLYIAAKYGRDTSDEHLKALRALLRKIK